MNTPDQLQSFVPHHYEVASVRVAGSACFVETRPTHQNVSGYRDTLMLGGGLSASWAEIIRPCAMEEVYECSGALKIHLRLAGASSLTDGHLVPHGIEASSFSALLQPRGASKIEIFGAGVHERSLTVSCSREFLEQELGLIGAGGPIGRYLDGQAGNFTLLRGGLSPAMRRAAQCFFEPSADLPARRLLLQARIHDILRECMFGMKGGGVPAVRPRHRALATQLAARLDAELRDPPRLDAYARKAGVSVSQLARSFKSAHGETISGYALSVRMRQAMKLLRDTQRPIGLVAFDVGYEHPGNFSTAFRRYFGMSPREARTSRAVR